MSEERLQKVLAAAGLGSRRSCETLIEQGRVSVDGETVTRLGAKVDPDAQEVRCDGEVVRPRRKVYYLINKPRGVVCTNSDERDRPRVVDLLPNRDERLFTVGRLDVSTEGLLIVTNDGRFAQRVAHPRYGITKTYRARVSGLVSDKALDELQQGVWIAGHRCAALSARVLKRRKKDSLVEIVMAEGRKREVRRMLKQVGYPVEELRRTRIGPLTDDSLAPGKYRKLNRDEVRMLLEPGSNKKTGGRRGKPRARADRGAS